MVPPENHALGWSLLPQVPALVVAVQTFVCQVSDRSAKDTNLKIARLGGRLCGTARESNSSLAQP